MELFEELDLFTLAIEKLDFSIAKDDSEFFQYDIIFLNNIPNHIHPKISFYLEFAESLEADAVYFRYYDDNRYCIPQVYFYDNTDNIRSKEQIAEIHKKVYSSCQVPAICVIDDKKISLYDERIPVKKISKSKISNQGAILKEVKQKDIHTLKSFFSAQSLNSGLFWESKEASAHFHNNRSAYEVLLKELIKIRTELNNLVSNNISNDFCDDLLFKCILAKYLEENAKEEKINFAEEFYKNEGLQYLTLKENIENKNLHNLFECLENHFNGNVFFLSENEKNILNNLEDDKFYQIAALLDGKIENQQLSIWEIYSFKHIPIELISNFYEEFINEDEKKNSGTVYTPSFLVNFLIDECLPINFTTTDYNIKLIDVSCGSGIFISSAFKRLVQRYRIAKKGKGVILDKKKIKLNDVKQILIQNIFGVDKNKTAVKLTKFSLQLALCQVVPNNELWNWTDDKVQVFEDLNQNISNEDFFDFLVKEQYTNYYNYFDWIIGNPPFTSLSSKEYKAYSEKLSPKFEFSVKIPDNQLALMFLEASNLLLKEKGNLCFIQKSTSLLYNKNSKEFKESLFNNLHVYQIIDFTLLKNYLFKSSKGISVSKNKKPTSVETCAVFYSKDKVEDYDILHIVSRLLKSTKDGLFFEFDYYDFHEVTKNEAILSENIWRCNLLGGNRLNQLIKKLFDTSIGYTTLQNYISNILQLENDRFAVGFQIASQKDPADFITEKRILLGKNFNTKKTKYTNFLASQKFHRPRKPVLYDSPLINIKTAIEKNKIAMVFQEIDTAFNETIVGISAPKEKTKELKRIYDIINQNSRTHILQTISSSAMFYLGSTTPFQKQDIDNWIIPLDSDKIILSKDEKIIRDDVLDYIYPSWYEGEKAKINKDNADLENLLDYSEVFTNQYNLVYQRNEFSQKLNKIIEGDYYYALKFSFDDKHEKLITPIKSEENLEHILINQVSHSKRINRIIKIYGNNSIIFIKPKNLRYWLKSIALRDIDDVFNDVLSNN
ncbi:MAG: DNA methyltransferase [Gelidibacter sp.]